MVRSRYIDILLFAGLICWVSIFAVQPVLWSDYLPQLTALALFLLPVWLFCWYRDNIPAARYRLYWLLCFPGYLGLGFLVTLLLQPNTTWAGLMVSTIVGALLLELLLLVVRDFRQRVRHNMALQRLSLEMVSFIVILLIAVIISAMAVSSIGKPAYMDGGQQLIGFELDIRQFFRYFGTFLSYCAQFLLMYGCGYLFFFINSRFLVPQVLKDRGIIPYVLSVLAVIAILYPPVAQLIVCLPINNIFGNILPVNPFVLENAFFALLIMLFSLPVVLAIQWSKQNTRIMALEQEKARTELDLLKQQLNPHFFFNTLNNLYALSLQRSNKAPESILQLSELMRYVIYKGQEERVPLTEELKYIEDYMRLQQIRLKHTPDIRLEQATDQEQVYIAPMLLIILVENAFKHGIEPGGEDAWLHMQLRCTQQHLYFVCENSFEEQPQQPGIGLLNLQKRLALLYPGKHQFRTEVKNHTFKAELEIDLS